MRPGTRRTRPETTPADPRSRWHWRIFGCGLALVIFLLIVIAVSL
jgi:hypothetical protein